MDVAIRDTKEFNQNKTNKLLTANQIRAGAITRNSIGKRLYSYFQKWRDETDHYKNTMEGKVKFRILKCYSKRVGSYFDHWKKNVYEKELRKRKKIIMDLQSENHERTNEALNGEKDLRVKEEGVRTSKRKMVDKTFKKLFFRTL